MLGLSRSASYPAVLAYLVENSQNLESPLRDLHKDLIGVFSVSYKSRFFIRMEWGGVGVHLFGRQRLTCKEIYIVCVLFK